MKDFESIDYFTDPDLPADPYPYFDFLLTHPVWREPHHGVVMVSGYEEALAVSTDATRFSACNFVAGPEPNFPVPLEGDDVTEIIERYRDCLPSNELITAFDPPHHTHLRGLIMRLITPKRLSENEQFMWRLADRQLDEVLPLGECDFIGDFAAPFTLLTVSELLGVPEADHPYMLESMGMTTPGSRKGRSTVGAVGSLSPGPHNSLQLIHEYFERAIEDRRRNPRDDVLNAMAHATFPDGTLPDAIEGARVASNLFAAAQETTIRLLGTIAQRLGDHPDEQEMLRTRRDLIANFVEETLRTGGPTKGNFRLAKVTTKLGGVDIPAGTTVMIVRGAASRDPRRFECPGEFRVDRANARQHLIFGHGIHTCPGSPLARSEVRIAIQRLFDRTGWVEISEERHGPPSARRYDYLPSYMFRGLTELYVRFRPVDTRS
jgi:cytochrome P450